MLLVDSEGKLLDRPWLTTVIDSYSRCIVGINLGYDAPSSQVVSLALRHAILPKQYGVEYGLHEQWGTYCYGESPHHRIEWQLKSVDRCHQHQLRLLSECPKCGARFKVPALWVDGWCQRCFTPFGEMKECQKSI